MDPVTAQEYLTGEEAVEEEPELAEPAERPKGAQPFGTPALAPADELRARERLATLEAATQSQQELVGRLVPDRN